MHLTFDNIQLPDVMTLGFFLLLFRTVDMLDYLIIWDELTLFVVLKLPLSEAISDLFATTYEDWHLNWNQLHVKMILLYFLAQIL